MKAPVGLLSDRTVLRSKMEGLCPDKFQFVALIIFLSCINGIPERLWTLRYPVFIYNFSLLSAAARRAAMEGTVITEGGTAQAAHDMHKVCHVIVHKDDIVHLLAEIQRRHQQHGDRDAAGEARQRGEHDKHEHDAGRTQQPCVGEQDTLQHAGDQRGEQNALEQRNAAVFFLHGRAHHQQQQHIIEKMLPVCMAQHMTEQPDVTQRVPPRGAVHAEQVHGAPAVRPAVCQQHQHGQQKKGKDHRRVILELQFQLDLFRKQSFPSQYYRLYPLVCTQYAPML